MYSVVSKFIVGSILISSICIMPSCGNDTSEQDAARELYNKADSAYKEQNYILSQQLIDSLQAKYPKQISIQRDALHLRPKAIEGATINEIEVCDSLIATLQQQKMQLESKFVFVNNPQLVDGYYVAKTNANSNLFGRTGIESRITPEGRFYILSSLTAKPIKHTSISLICGNQEVKSLDVPYDGERNYRSSGTEMITFVPEECDTLGRFASINRDKSITMVFNGKSSYKQKLSVGDIKAIADTYELSELILELASAKRKRELLDQQLMLARNQIARTMKDSVMME